MQYAAFVIGRKYMIFMNIHERWESLQSLYNPGYMFYIVTPPPLQITLKPVEVGDPCPKTLFFDMHVFSDLHRMFRLAKTIGYIRAVPSACLCLPFRTN